MKKFNPAIKLLLVVSVFLAAASCRNTPSLLAPPAPRIVEVPVPFEVVDTRVPLTIATLQRMNSRGGDISEIIKDYQLHIFGRVGLERAYIEPVDSIKPGGRASFENVHTRESLIIQDQTSGQVVNYEFKDGEILLYVGFDNNSDNYLVFSSPVNNPNGYFFLKHEHNPYMTFFGDERGTVVYGGWEYRVKYAREERPHLLIKLSRLDSDKLRTQTLEGRIVE